jgi:uncharacterized membrane protein (DUF2068 family)
MQRPTGITVLAILYFVSGGLTLATSCIAVMVGSWLTATAARPGYVLSLLATGAAVRGEHAFWLGLIGTVASLVKLVAAAGLWALQPWAWGLALIGGALKLATHVVAVTRGAITPAGVVGALVNGAVLVYLFTPHVRRALSGVPDLDVPDDPADDLSPATPAVTHD